MGIILEGNFINIVDSSNSEEKNKNEELYIDYIETHRENVKAAYEKYFLPLLDDEFELNSCSVNEFKKSIEDATHNISVHDESKYSDIEFTPYRIRFYPTTNEKAALENSDIAQEQAESFAIAWKHHYSNNPHHPNYWVNEETGEIADMQLRYIVEMLCDWLSFGDDIRVWYKNEAETEKKAMSIRTQEIVVELMDLIYSKA